MNRHPRDTARVVIASLYALALAATTACSRESDLAEAQRTADAIGAQLGGDSTAECAMLTRAEIEPVIGEDVDEGTAWTLGGGGCEWRIDDDRAVRVVFVPGQQYYEDLSKADGGAPLTGIGQKAFVASWLGEYRAGALMPQGAVYLMAPTREQAVALLPLAAARAPGG